jgi:hypothetical protein
MAETAINFGDNGGERQTGNPRLGQLHDGIAKAIDRVATIVDLETESLRSFRPIDLAAFNHQKSHGLLDLTRALRALPPGGLDQVVLHDLARLREKLEKNLAVLDIHLKAVRQVSAVIARAIEDDNSDGTYSVSINQAARYYD